MQNERRVVELPIEDVLPNRFQPRIKFDQKSINELAVSIKKYGVIQPIVVRQIGTKYEIIAGERRYKASVLAGKRSIPAIISELSDKDSVEIALIENVQREDLTPIEKAISYKKILDMGYITQEDLAEKVGKSQSSIANTLRLLNLTDEVQEALLENKISERHARSLLKIKDNKKQVEMLNRIINERLTVRKTDEEIDKMFNEETNTFENNFSSPSNDFTQPSDEIVNIPDTEINNQIDSNSPGFMNIDKIEQNAVDINYENNKSAVDMDQLLTSTSTQLTNDVEVVPNDTNLHSNKFFNFFDEDNSDAESSGETNSILNIPSVETPTFEVPNMPSVETPTYEVPNISSVETPTYEVPNIPSIETPTFEVPNMPSIETPTYEVPNIPSIETPTYEVPNMPSLETPTYEVPNIPSIETPTFEVPNIPSIETPTFEVPNMPSIETPAFEVPSMPSVETPTFEVPNIPSVETPTFEVPNIPSVETPTYEVPNMPSIETPTFEVPNIPSVETPMHEEEIIPTIEVGPIENPYINDIQNSEIPNEYISIPSVETPNIKLALNAIRDCENTLEKLGFIVDSEEIDFEDNYQVIFKIKKQ